MQERQTRYTNCNSILTTQVKEPDQDGWKKLLRKMAYLKNMKDMLLLLEAKI